MAPAADPSARPTSAPTGWSVAPPTLPKGGGAIRGIGETFTPDLMSGTGSMAVPLALPAGRTGFGPALSLTYGSGSGNGVFGIGWSIGVPSISRRTERGLPLYDDVGESDVFLLGNEELVRLDEPDDEVIDPDHVVRRYRPRRDRDRARVERWTHRSGASHWRTISADDVLTVYGLTSAERVSDPADERRVFSWLVSEQRDDRGNAIAYRYRPDDGTGVDVRRASERHRGPVDDPRRQAERHLVTVRYGNRRPFLGPDGRRPRFVDAATRDDPAQWLFEVVFDYGDHDDVDPQPEPDRPWARRPDPFSSYRAGFEVRTMRRCRRILTFHHTATYDGLVGSTDLAYDDARGEHGARYSVLRSVKKVGYRRDGDRLVRRALPPLELEHTRAVLDPTVGTVALPADVPLAGPGTAVPQWVDLDGEGVPGLLVDRAGTWTFHPNATEPGGPAAVAEARPLAERPTWARSPRFGDLDGDSRIDLVGLDGPTPGLQAADGVGGWDGFRPLGEGAVATLLDPGRRLLDLAGDGRPDAFAVDDEAVVWQRGDAATGFGPEVRAPFTGALEAQPRLVARDATQALLLADLSGDGQADLVRVRNAEVTYWPNLGHGRFGPAIVMDHLVPFDRPDLFSPERLRVADVDGSGPSDLVYLGRDGARLYANRSGNGFAAPVALPAGPRPDEVATADLVDLFGDGTTCLVWVACATPDVPPRLRYVRLVGDRKPHLLVRAVNNMGGETVVEYGSSTGFARRDAAAGRRWRSGVPMPIAVVSRVETIDHIGGVRTVRRFAYHEGTYDRREREMLGFGEVESWDTEDLDGVGGAAPVRTVSWFHTGVAPDHVPSPTVGPGPWPAAMTADEEREAHRALGGSLLREEVYALDGTARAARPYVVRETSHAVRLEQRAGSGRRAVFTTHEAETLERSQERQLDDPRVQHVFTLAVDAFGTVLRSATVGYGRAPEALERAGLPTAEDRAAQTTPLVSTMESTPTEAVADPRTHPDHHRRPQPAEVRTFELTGRTPTGPDGRFRPEDLTDGGDRRLLSWTRTRYRADDLGRVLDLFALEPRAVPGEVLELALTADLLASVLVRDDVALLPDPTSVLARPGGAGGGYTATDDLGGAFWVRHDEVRFSPGTDDDAATELAHAARHFFLPHRLRTPFHTAAEPAETHVTYDEHDLLCVSSVDEVGNEVRSEPDHRVLQPRRLTDANGNVTEVVYDALGRLAAMAVQGQPGRPTGDSLDGLEVDLSDTALAAWVTDPMAVADRLLGKATTRFVNDSAAHWRNRARAVAVGSYARELHVGAVPDGERSPIQCGVVHVDGFGREVQRKAPAEPGRGADGEPGPARWVATGSTVYDAKGRPVVQHEPAFTATHAFEPIVGDVAVTTVRDPLGRVVATIHPDHSYEKVVYGAWEEERWDRNDTVLDDPRTDPDVAGMVAGHLAVPAGAGWQTWYQRATGPGSEAHHQRAAEKAAAHAATPTTVHLDVLGRPFLTIVRDGQEEHADRIELDIEGNHLSVRDADTQGGDARGRIVARFAYDLVGRRIRDEGIDSGTRWTVDDASSKTLRTWDQRGRTGRNEYDANRRLVRSHLAGVDPADPDHEVLVEVLLYGEDVPDGAARNLRGSLHLHLDQAGANRTEERDLDARPTRASRRFTAGTTYRGDVDWRPVVESADGIEVALAAVLDDEVFTVTTTYDALGRQIEVVAPATSDAGPSTVRTRYNEANLVEAVDVRSPGSAGWSPFLTAATYDARGNRTRTEHGNGVVTETVHDPATNRLVHVLTTRGADTVQDLRYTYDPEGNVVEVADGATPTVFFANQVVAPGGSFTYDARYRLVEATGREHLGSSGQAVPPAADDHLRRHLLPGDGAAMARWTERYVYDDGGNLLRVAHSRSGRDQQGWEQVHRHREPSQLEPGKTGNRLSDMTVSGDTGPGRVTYDQHGMATHVPHLAQHDGGGANLHWGLRDELRRADLGGGGTIFTVCGSDGRRLRRVWEKTATLVEERIDLGVVEVHRRRRGDEVLVRETLHVAVGGERIALVETRTVDTAGADKAPAQVVRYQHRDHLGSTTVELDDRARLLTHEELSPYGSTTYHAAAPGLEAPKRYRFTGKERDEGTGFGYHGARYYAPWLGRWITPDRAGVASGPNAYVYAKGNPLGLVDLDGREDKAPMSNGEMAATYARFAGTMILGEDPVDLAKKVVKSLGAATIDPFITIFGPDGMLAKAAAKGVDRAMGIEKPNSFYVTEEDHQKQLWAIVDVGALLFPGVKGALPKMPNIGGPQLALAGGGKLALSAIELGGESTVTTMQRSMGIPRGLIRRTAETIRRRIGRSQFWIEATTADLRASQRQYQVYILRDRRGRVLYIGKAGGADGMRPNNWIHRLRAHVADTTKGDWIESIDTVTVRSDLTEMEAFAEEENLIAQTKIDNTNILPGDFSTRFPGSGFAENVRSASSQPVHTFNIDIVR